MEPNTTGASASLHLISDKLYRPLTHCSEHCWKPLPKCLFS